MNYKKGLAASLGNSRRSIENKKWSFNHTNSDLLKNNIHININIGNKKKIEDQRKKSMDISKTQWTKSKNKLFQLFNQN